MTIENGYYVANCTSLRVPVSHKDMGTFYLPIDVKKVNDEFEYKEYRFNLPITYPIPIEVVEYMAHELDEYRKALKEVGVV